MGGLTQKRASKGFINGINGSTGDPGVGRYFGYMHVNIGRGCPTSLFICEYAIECEVGGQSGRFWASVGATPDRRFTG